MIKIFVHYYVDKYGNIILELRKIIKDKEQIKRILEELLRKGEVDAKVVLSDRIKSRYKIIELLRMLKLL